MGERKGGRKGEEEEGEGGGEGGCSPSALEKAGEAKMIKIVFSIERWSFVHRKEREKSVVR